VSLSSLIQLDTRYYQWIDSFRRDLRTSAPCYQDHLQSSADSLSIWREVGWGVLPHARRMQLNVTVRWTEQWARPTHALYRHYSDRSSMTVARQPVCIQAADPRAP
jgi:hypothetical protein